MEMDPSSITRAGCTTPPTGATPHSPSEKTVRNPEGKDTLTLHPPNADESYLKRVFQNERKGTTLKIT